MADAAPARLNDQLASAGLGTLNPETTSKFESYLSLFVRWNSRLNLSSVRHPDAILERHFIESISVARDLPPGVQTLLDFGSGGGLPGIPIALCRPEISVTLAESQTKKAAFLQEAVRVLGITAKVHADRAEALTDGPAGAPRCGADRVSASAPGSHFDCVVLRAVDKMPQAARAAVDLVAPNGWLALMTTDPAVSDLQSAAGELFRWNPVLRLPGSDSRILALGQIQRREQGPSGP
jgi:16S rRNA (guanine527-N7)-methyltransferase